LTTVFLDNRGENKNYEIYDSKYLPNSKYALYFYMSGILIPGYGSTRHIFLLSSALQTEDGEKRKMYCPCPDSNTDASFVQPIA
jgi:hypothetical protein